MVNSIAKAAVRTVVLVDDDSAFTMSLSDGLHSKRPEYTVLTAENGEKAVAFLRSHDVDLVVTDLNMPIMDGFQLLSFMKGNFPEVPVIVMTAYGTPDIEDSMKRLSIHYVDKPINFGVLADLIEQELQGAQDGFIRGVTLPAFLQLVEMEKKTCTIRAASENAAGHLWFRGGELLQARTGNRDGAEAAYEILGWDDATIEIESTCRVKKRQIELSLGHLLMESFRLKDERERNSRPHNNDAKRTETRRETCSKDTACNDASRIGKETVMALEKHLQALTEIKGFKAAGIMSYTGEMLASESKDGSIDLGLVGATFNDIFRSAHEASKKIGLDACRETIINTPKGVVVMRCSGVDAPVHFHVLGVMAADGNQALMKMQIEKMVDPVMDELK